MPRPIPENARIAYLTNVYTRPDWPSEESVAFYKREGFAEPDEPLIWHADAGSTPPDSTERTSAE